MAASDCQGTRLDMVDQGKGNSELHQVSSVSSFEALDSRRTDRGRFWDDTRLERSEILLDVHRRRTFLDRCVAEERIGGRLQ